jgi:hypothetical protein
MCVVITMKMHYYTGAIIGMALLAASPATTASEISWIKWVSSDETTLNSSSPWDGAGTSIRYTVSYNQTANDLEEFWKYEYVFEVPRKEIGHLIIEVASDGNTFSEGNIFSGTTDGYSLDSYGSTQSNSNPGIPGDMYGMKWDIGSLGQELVIISDRAPQRGDFYARSGRHGGHFVYAYNSGFLDTDNDPQIDIAQIRMGNLIFDHILLPGTVTGIPPSAVVPVPAAIWLFGSGLSGFIGMAGWKKAV